ncbi:RE1 [Symbiodinium sp. CCMP2592]|nr:RE1 [Symbiodinium sp. CCMP2592]
MSGDSEKDGGTTRSREGVPSWNGEASSFTAYEEAALLWEQGMVYNKRYTAAPRLMAELSGAAKRLVAGKPASEVAHVGGVRILLDYLRKALGKPRVNEVTDLLSRYFKGTRRRQGESMNDYITRKSEAFLRVSQALKRVQPHYQRGKAVMMPQTQGRRASDASSYWGPGGWSRQNTEAEDPPEDDDDEDNGTQAADGAATDAWSQRRPSSSWGSSWGWSSNAWSWERSGWEWGYPNWNWTGPVWSTTSWTGSTLTSAWDSIETIEDEHVLPAFIQGWYLLMDAALDSNEKNLVLTAISGDFSPGRVAQELRNQFPEGDLRRKDSHRRSHAFLGTLDEDYEYEEADGGWTAGDYGAEELDEDEAAMMTELEQETNQAFAAFQNARRTLKEARMKQHSVKLNRQIIEAEATKVEAVPAEIDHPQTTARWTNCPTKQVAANTDDGAQTSDSTHQAPFVCFAEDSDFTEMALSTTPSAPTTSEAVAAGMAVVDGGATRTLGSVAAVEALLRRNRQLHGSSRLCDLDPQNRPVFGFGNSSENQCLSTCKIGVTAGGQAGQVQVHTLDCGQGPILLSVDALRSLGAVVDFRNDLMVLSALDNTRIIPLQRSAAGHQLLSLTKDLFQDAHRASSPHDMLRNHLVILSAVFLAQKHSQLCPSQASQLLHPIMDRLNKSELILHLRSLGEEAPENWGKLELQQRISELAEEQPALATTTLGKTPLEDLMSKINKASRKKSVLRSLLEDELRVTVGENDTIAAMQRKATVAALDRCEPHPNDYLGFGKHSQLTMIETYERDRDYCKWVVATAAEGEASQRLKRFSKWLVKIEEEAKATGKEPVSVPRPKSRTSKITKANTEAQPSTSMPSTSREPDPRDELLIQMANNLRDLQEEEDHSEQGVKDWVNVAMSPAGGDMSPSATSGSSVEAMSATTTVLSDTAAGALEHRSSRILPRAFHELVGQERPDLLEIGCAPNSMLTQVFQKKGSDVDAASRCCVWHGCALSDMRTTHGLQLAVEQIRGLNPKHVWITVPGSPYSPMQRANQRDSQQVRELREKREEAIATYHAAREIMRVCLHMGIHCTVEMSENSEAWRLPVFQELQHGMGLSVATVKGCAVGLQGRQGKLLMKGWRLVTTHQRLAFVMHKPCRCDPSYVHEKGNGSAGRESIQHTPEFARLVHQALQEEFGFSGIVKECQGASSLPEGFGQGEICGCGDAYLQKHSLHCGNCLLTRDAVPFYEDQNTRDPEQPKTSTQDQRTDGTSTALLAQSHGPDSETPEAKAKALSLKGTLGYKDLEAYLEENPPGGKASGRNMIDHTHGTYHTYGSYAFGNHYGLTRRTVDNPEFVRMINQFLAQRVPKDYQWSAFTLNANSTAPLHKDINNDETYPNCSVGIGDYSGGELWLEGSRDSDTGTLEIRNIGGERVSGIKVDIHHKPYLFQPKLWHGTCAWKGQRWVLTAYVTRGLDKCSSSELRKLREWGFRVPTKQSPQALAVNPVSDGTTQDPRTPRLQDERIRKQLYLLHCASGHGSIKHLVEALQRRRAPPRVIELAKEFSCPVCAERSKPPPRAQATLEPLPPKFSTISADVGHWEHPHSKEAVQFMLVIDEGSRFRVARVLTRGSKQQPTANACIQYLQEGWGQYFGHPRALRVDPAGSFRSRAFFDSYCDKHGVYLDIIPGEAHWKNGSCEQAIQGVKELMTRLCTYDPELSTESALAEATTVFNHRDLVRGFSPAQHVLGRGADETDRFLEAGNGLPPGLLVENPVGEFQRATERRAEAEKAHAEWHARQRLNRARNSRHRPCYNYVPGELVFFWRSQESGQGRRQPGTKQGRFLGPARILATETRQSKDGELSPGGAVWLVRGRSLIKCAPEQLRRATEREELLEGLASQQGQATPWTFTRVASSIGGNQFQDLSGDVPDTTEWRRAQDVTEEVPPTRYRQRLKRAPPAEPEMDEEWDHHMQGVEAASSSRVQRPRMEASFTEQVEPGECWWSTIPSAAWPKEESSFWTDKAAAVEVEVELPPSHRGLIKMANNFEGFFVGQLRRQAVEVSERRLTPSEQEEFRAAKEIEVKNFISADAFEALPAHLQPSRDQAVNMRWILTWKLKDNGDRKAKARAVLLGYQDPSYEHRRTAAPVMTRQSRQMHLQMAAWKRWKLRKGDVSGAFLQGRAYPDTLFCIPTKEICQAMNIPEQSVTRLKRAVYGLVDAPLEWYRTVNTFFESIGLERLASDSCVWCYRSGGELKGMISAHVDDFIFGGQESDSGWQSVLQQIREQFRWGDWEEDSFTQCGVLVETTNQGIELSQPKYLENLSEIGVSASRRKDRSGKTTERERTQLRALLGGLSWHAQQVSPHLSADVSLLLSEVSDSTVDTIIRANILLSHAKARSEHKLLIHAFDPETPLGLVAWVDAASQSRKSGGSTQGIVIGMAPLSLLDGDVCGVSLMSWHSSKIDRVCRSPGASEALAAINGEDNLYYARYQWAELLYGCHDLRRPDELVNKTSGCLVTDSRNVYDKMTSEVVVVKGAEKRTSIELLGLKEAQRRTNVIIRWVHSEAQLANSLTKENGLRELELYYKMRQHWRIVEDERMLSARRRRELGLQPLSQATSEDADKDS